MKKSLFTVIFIFSSMFCAVAQKSNDTNGENIAILAVQNAMNMSGNNANSLQMFDQRYSGVKGSPFFIDKFTEGELYMADGKVFKKEFKYRFNENTNSLHVQNQKDQKEIVIENKEINYFRLFVDSSTFVFFKTILPSGDKSYKICQVLHWGNTYRLLKFPQKRMVRVDKTGAYDSGERFDTFEPNPEYFLQVNNAPLEPIKLNKKSFKKALPNQASKLEQLFDTPQYKGNFNAYKAALLLADLEK